MKNTPFLKRFSLSLLALSLTSSAAAAPLAYTSSKHAVELTAGDTTITLTMVNDNIIRVEKVKKGIEVQTLKDYVTVLKPQGITWSIEEQGDNILIKNAGIQASVNPAGEVSFMDAKGKPLTQETASGSIIDKSDGAPFDVVQRFTAGDEGLYGLGQYQSGIMNWKNTPVRLQQYNQEIAIPFLVSTKGYGIYWNNYSVTDFNHPDNELKFPEEPDAKGIRKMSFTPSKTGEYTFMATSNHRAGGRVELTIDGDSVINYDVLWMLETYSGKKMLEAGKTYTIQYQNQHGATAGEVYYNEPDFNQSTFSSRYGDKIDYYIMTGNTPADVLAQNSELTGKAPMFAKSAYGFWQCRERYATQDELLENAREMRKREIPFDNIVQDWFYWPAEQQGPDWDPAKYPNPKAMVDELREMNIKLMVSVWPRVYNEKLLTKHDVKEHLLAGNNLDVYNPEVAKKFYQMLSDNMFKIGVKSIWLDGTEPEDKSADNLQTAGGTFGQVANTFSLLVTKAAYEGHRAEFPNERVFNLTRSAYSGQQRYAACSWSGDVAGTWEQFGEQVAAGLNFTMAGVPYWTTDIGGFFRDARSNNPIYDEQYTNKEFIELMTRWFQFGCFNPVFRIHGFISKTEVWRYGNEFEQMARKFIDLRYALMPYIYSTAHQVTTKGTQMFVPLAYSYPQEKKVWGIKDQFTFGEAFLVNPVMSYGARERELYLPEGTWYDFWTNERMEGGKTITSPAPFDSLPLFVKAGSIVPIGPKVQYATEPTKEATEIRIYPGKDAHFSLYLDDNETYMYERHDFSTIEIDYDDATQTVTLTLGNPIYFNAELKSMNFRIRKAGSVESIETSFTGETLQFKIAK